MTNLPPPTYRHTQKGPWHLVLWSVGAVSVAVAWLVWEQAPVPAVILAGTGLFLLVLGACFDRLTVADEGDRLAIQFGFLPLFRTRIRYADIRAVEIGRTTLLDGFGIHRSLQGGWVWNIWGWECVVIRHRGTTRVGTDDAENLATFLKTKIPVAADHE
jgi:hypothetical protein